MKDSEFERRLIAMEPILRAVARGYFRSTEDQKDAVQECMVKAWQARARLKSAEALEGWVVRIMRNECANVCRKNGVCVRLSEENAAPADDPIRRLIERDALLGALSLLPPRSRDMVRAHFLEGCSLRELARTHGLSIGTVQSRLYRSLKRLAPLLSA